MSQKPTSRGVIAPMLTPFTDDGAPDADRFVAHGKWLLDDGCHALAVFGTTGEANSLSFEERRRLLEALVEGGIEPARLMVGTGTCALSETVEATKHALGLGCESVLMLPPFYYKAVDDEGLYAYMAEVIERVGDAGLDIYLYHIPPVAQVGFSVDLVKRLATAFPENVVGLKDSTGNWDSIKAMIEAAPGLNVFAGTEAFLLETLRAGGAGTITATGNVNAHAIRHLYDNWQKPDAEALQDHITSLRQTLQQRPMIPILKAIVAHYRGDPGWARLRPPFLALDAVDAAAGIAELEQAYGFKLEAA
ncbi:MAG: dihydrodipicolinate synthase family protein [Methyloligellaceae bacterium]